MKKLQQDIENSEAKKPRTELDVKFLAAIADYMSRKGISSDRAMSIELGRKENFVNRVRNGYQSATPEAWDALMKMSPKKSYEVFISHQHADSEHLSRITESLKSIGAAQGGTDVDHIKPKSGSGEADVTNMFVPYPIHEALLRENELLRSQLADKERIIQLLEKSSK